MNEAKRDFYEFGTFRLDPVRRALLRDGRPISLQPKAFDLLCALIGHADRVVTKDELLKAVWPDVIVEEANLAQSIFVLRKVLEDRVSNPRYIVTVPGRGYRFVEAVRRVHDGHAPQHGEQRQSTSAEGRTMLVVLPFRNLTGDPEQEYVADGVTEELITQIGRLDPEHLAVIACTSAYVYKGSDKRLDQIGGELSAGYVVEGGVRRDPARLRITVQLSHASDQRLVWSQAYDRPTEDILRVQDEVAAAVAREILHRLAAQGRVADGRTIGPEAYDSYLRGRFFLNTRSSEGITKAIKYFERALVSEPVWAPFHAALGQACIQAAYYGLAAPNEALPRARAAARQALAIDGDLGSAYAVLGMVALQYDRDWTAARNHFVRALELDPNDPFSHQAYANYLGVRGQFDEAVAQLRRGYQLDPMSPSLNAALAILLCHAGRWHEGLEQFDRTFEIAPDFVFARYWLSQLYASRGLYDRALAEVERLEALSPMPFAAGQRGYIAALQGRRSEALAIAEALGEFTTRAAVDPVHVAEIYAVLGESDSAFGWLERGYEQHTLGMIRLSLAPAYAPIRADPRFVDLLNRCGVLGAG